MGTLTRPLGSHMLEASWTDPGDHRTVRMRLWSMDGGLLPRPHTLAQILPAGALPEGVLWGPDAGSYREAQPWERVEALLERGMDLSDLALNPHLHSWEATVLTVATRGDEPQSLSVQLEGILTRPEVEKIHRWLGFDGDGGVAAVRWEPRLTGDSLDWFDSREVATWAERRVNPEEILRRMKRAGMKDWKSGRFTAADETREE